METKKTQPISALKTMTWKSDVASPFKTPQECVRRNGNRVKKPALVRQTKTSESPCIQRSSTSSTLESLEQI
jgi:hypothetical protein